MVGMTLTSWYDESTRNMYIYECPFPWGWFCVFLLAAAALYITGKHLFLKKEV